MKKKLTGVQIIDLIAGVIMEIALLFPWIEAQGMRLNNLTYFLYGLKPGNRMEIFHTYIFPSMNVSTPEATVIAPAVWIGTLILVIMSIITIVQIVGSFTNHSFRILQGIGFVLLLDLLIFVSTMVNQPSVGVIEPPGRLYAYIGIVCAIQGAWIMFGKMEAEWEEACKRAEAEREAWREYQRQRKIRLKFPGRYSQLYYKVLWKSFLNRWNSFSYLFAAVSLAVMFLFIGLSMDSIFTAARGSGQGILGLGIEEIMSNFLIVAIVISLFLVTTILVFYRKRRVMDTGIMQTLGIRSKASGCYWMFELLAGLISAITVGIALGYAFILILCLGTSQNKVVQSNISRIDGSTYIATICIVVVICLCAYGFSHEIQASNQTMDVRGMTAKSDPMPGRFAPLFWVICTTVALFCMNLYGQRRTMESVMVLCGFFIGLYGVVYFGWSIMIRKREGNVEKYIPSVPKVHMVRHRYRTTVRYIMILTMLHVSILFFFCMRVVSNSMAIGDDTTYPYNYMFLANSSDQELVQELKSTYEEIYIFPMMRVTAMDATDELEPPRKLIEQQAQNIGISEKTYRELKQLAGEKPKDNLGLDDNGEKVYIVYQQDKGTPAQPLDRYQFTRSPYIHIGQPLFGYNLLNYRPYYPERKIAGEEVSSLTGCFGKGRYENLVVFSDMYFEKVQNSWQNVDKNTGETYSVSENIDSDNIYEYPTTLVLCNTSASARQQMNQTMQEFQSAHSYDESFDVQVKSAYSKTEAMDIRQRECLLETIVNGCISVLFLIVSLLLVHMKVNMELSELKERYKFMACFGMSKKERVSLEKKEVSRYVIIPLVMSACIVPIFTGVVWHMRGFKSLDMMRYMGYGGIYTICYVLIQILNLRFLQRNIVRKVEENIGK